MASAITKQELLSDQVKHIDIKETNVVPLIDQMADTAFQARNLARAASIVDRMQKDHECAVILTLAGSLISSGLKQVIIDMLENNMVDAIVSTGANIVDQDFFEALGFRHYKGTPFIDDAILRDMHVDRIYDTYIDEDDLRVCDETTGKIADSMPHGAYSSREFIIEMARYIEANGHDRNSIVYKAYEKGVPIFCPAFSDCSAGFGLVHHQWNNPGSHVSIDSVKDFRELTRIKIENDRTGIFMIGGGVPKNFTQDIVVAAEVLGYEDVSMHTYAVQITVADERDGALSGSTLKEASSWGKVDTVFEQMVYAEATIAMPLIAGYAYHRRSWEGKKAKNFNEMLDRQQVTA
ncbi:1,9-bis(guanidino)-5-aza-nonane synthase [Pelodictyon luteolum]|uniref:Deoxyhypusine synthase-like protein n=1 Tax=Chlorobium luteolum (strain DSM 273 / BCRC 81028 / 2530) TaxID=319225 RepID=Q3B150_CHLL3|nr:deoxyhypusine synthase [Pelodictyon luteolum]ABB24931.1 homospermidine synthase (spermidine-specific) [Pelodictyon luteolum DSM 273]